MFNAILMFTLERKWSRMLHQATYKTKKKEEEEEDKQILLKHTGKRDNNGYEAYRATQYGVKARKSLCLV